MVGSLGLFRVLPVVLPQPWNSRVRRAGWLDGWMVGWLDGWMAGSLDGWHDRDSMSAQLLTISVLDDKMG